MRGIQLVLLGGIAFLAIYFIIRIKKRLIDLLFLGLLISCAILFILWPDLTTVIAHKLGVGRGADLIFYVSLLLFWYAILKLYARIRLLEQKMTNILRDQALHNAIDFSKPGTDETNTPKP
jgi:hypothetical protein